MDALKAEHSRLQIARFLKVTRSFVVKVRKWLEAADGDSVAKPKRFPKGSHTIRTIKLIRYR